MLSKCKCISPGGLYSSDYGNHKIKQHEHWATKTLNICQPKAVRIVLDSQVYMWYFNFFNFSDCNECMHAFTCACHHVCYQHDLIDTF